MIVDVFVHELDDAVVAYLAADTGGMRVIDMSDPSSPAEVGYSLAWNGTECVMSSAPLCSGMSLTLTSTAAGKP